MMTKQAPSVIQMGREQLATLLTSVDERVATDVAYFEKTKKQKRFGALELWNIRRKAKYTGTRIR